MTSVIHRGKDKVVHFPADIDSEEEDRRSCRGSEARRKRKKAKEMANNQKENSLQAAFEILQNAQYEDDLVNISSHRPTRALLSEVIRQNNDSAAGDYRGPLRQALQSFRASGTTRDNLTRDEAESLDLLSQTGRFGTTFREYLPANAVSSEEEGSGGQRSRMQQDRRDSEQQAENDAKELLRNA